MASGAAQGGANVRLAVRLADAAAGADTIRVALGAGDLPRLAALVDASRQDAVGGTEIAPEAVATFAFAQHAAPPFVAVTVGITGQCALPCQRCLELTAVEIAVDTVLAVGANLDDAALDALDGRYERWDHDGETLALAEVADELILLDLPLVVTHERRSDCGALAGRLPEAGQGDAVSQRPFAGLQDLLAGKDN